MGVCVFACVFVRSCWCVYVMFAVLGSTNGDADADNVVDDCLCGMALVAADAG